MNHFQTYLVEEFAEDYQEGLLSRRDALKLIASVTGSLIMATTILSACAPAEEIQAGPYLLFAAVAIVLVSLVVRWLV